MTRRLTPLAFGIAAGVTACAGATAITSGTDASSAGAVDAGAVEASAHDAQLGPVCDPQAPQAVALAAIDQVVGLAVDGEHVYWATLSGEVHRVSKRGGGAQRLASGSGYSTGIVLDDAFVYWADQAGLLRAPKAGGSVQVVAQGHAERLAIGERTLAWFLFTPAEGGAGRTLRAAPKQGGTVVDIAQPAYGGIAVATDDVNVYWTDTRARGVRASFLARASAVALRPSYSPVRPTRCQPTSTSMTKTCTSPWARRLSTPR